MKVRELTRNSTEGACFTKIGERWMRCPGQDTRYWLPGDIFETACPHCGYKVEFFKDEPSRICKQCRKQIINPKMDFGCAAYCKFAEQCLGKLPTELMGQRDELFRNKVALEMKRYFNKDFKRIGHAGKVARYAEKIAQQEKSDMAVVLAAAYLHDIGIKQAEERYQSTDSHYQEELGPPIAKGLLEKIGAPAQLIEEVCDIIGHHHHPRQNETANFKALYDADMLVNLEEMIGKTPMDKEGLEKLINTSFLTSTGTNMARDLFFREKL